MPRIYVTSLGIELLQESSGLWLPVPTIYSSNEEGESGTHIMIGPDETGRLYTVILEDLRDAYWRPITGWESDRPEIQVYWEERAKHG